MPSWSAIAAASCGSGASAPCSTQSFERREPVHSRILLEQHDLRAGHDRPLALVGVDQPGEALEQRRLAGAVAADQRQPVALADVQVEVAEQPAFALDEAEAFVGQDRRGHGREVASLWP